jgi:hypothetical protein
MDIIQINKSNQSILKQFVKHIDGFVIPKLKENDTIFLLTKNQEYVAMIYFTISDDVGYINYVHTSENHRKKGHSSFLTEKMIQFSSKKNVKEIKVAILPDCGSDKVFLKLGFSYVGENEMQYFI